MTNSVLNTQSFIYAVACDDLQLWHIRILDTVHSGFVEIVNWMMLHNAHTLFYRYGSALFAALTHVSEIEFIAREKYVINWNWNARIHFIEVWKKKSAADASLPNTNLNMKMTN